MDEAGPEPDEPPQGWYVDPFGVHGDRWISQGRPTALVRDGGVESQDPPRDRPLPPLPLVRAASAPAPDDAPSDRSDASGIPVPGRLGTAPALPPADRAGARARKPTNLDDPPPTLPRLLRVRWITLGGVVVWTALLTLQFFGATTSVTTSPGHVRTETVYASDPGAVLSFIVLLVVCDVVTAVGFLRRVRAGSDRWSRSGAVCAGILGVLGILSLATVGLGLLLLSFLLVVVARPIRRPRPLPGERVAPPAGGH